MSLETLERRVAELEARILGTRPATLETPTVLSERMRKTVIELVRIAA